MTKFTVHTKDSAPQEAKPLLEAVQKAFGFIPNLLGKFAEAPSVLKAYLDVSESVSKGTLSASAKQVAQITASRVNGCEYCVAAHSTMSDMEKIPADIIAATREDSTLTDTKLEAVRQFTKAVVGKQGWVSDADVSAFLSAGYNQAQALEVVLIVTQKTLSNYGNHLVKSEVDQAFASRAIDLKQQRKAS
jgi:uncharacterized peroxidase-related enzyme